MKSIAVVVSDFGPEGAETTESISLILALSELKVSFQIFCLDTQYPLRHHQLKKLSELNAHDFDALVLPGGLGAAQILSNWKSDKKNFAVKKEIEQLIQSFNHESKPVAGICIASLIVGKSLKEKSPTITLGLNPEWQSYSNIWNVHLEKCPSDDFITDRDTKIITTPAYMNDDASPFAVYTGIRNLTKELVEMA